MKAQFKMHLYFILVIISISQVYGVINSNRKVCEGTDRGLQYSMPPKGTKPMRYQNYVAHYQNCSVVRTNLEITYLDKLVAVENETFDMSFLESIEEVYGYVLLAGNLAEVIPLPNLRVIHGRQLFENKHSLYVANNCGSNSTEEGLKEIRLNSLQEVVRGMVTFYRNKLLCHVDTINWNDTLSNPESTIHINNTNLRDTCNESCSENCYQNLTGSKHCWAPGHDNCQKFHRLICSENCEGNCFGPKPSQCCSDQCAGGCNGSKSQTDCWTCKNMIDGDSCVTSCPPAQIYNGLTYLWEPNPKVRYAYRHECVNKCPDRMYIRNGACVTSCGEGYTSNETLGRQCVFCGDACPKECPGGVITSQNIADYANCTTIQGPLQFLTHSFNGDMKFNTLPLNISDLRVFETVTTITECLQVEGSPKDLKSLWFLKNLRKILGHKLCNNNAYGLVLSKTNLQSVGLSSLESVDNGIVFLFKNSKLEELGLTSLRSVSASFAILGSPKLCYYHSLNWSVIAESLIVNTTRLINTNPTAEACREMNKTCSDQCEGGCWGPGDEHCFNCVSYRYERKCLQSCGSIPGLFADEDQKVCLRCHSECQGGCTGEGADNCTSCKNVRDGPYCREKCPSFKFADSQKHCQVCSSSCKKQDDAEECTGASNKLGDGGCNACQRYFEVGHEQFECRSDDFKCSEGYYDTDYIPTPKDVQIRNRKRTVSGCQKCHQECISCIAPGEECECRNYRQDRKCVKSCSLDRYIDLSAMECHVCHPLCMKCHGPTEYECIRCRFRKVYISDLPLHEIELLWNNTEFQGTGFNWSNTKFINSNLTDTNDEFVCVEECPESLPERVTEKKNGFSEDVCKTRLQAGAVRGEGPSYSNDDVYISLGVVGGILAALACAALFGLRIKARRKKEDERVKAELLGIRALEASSPSNYKPDLSNLRLIKETELTRGQAIGSGAFGTVYRGIWVPESERVKIPVAIKVLQKAASMSEANDELLDEARIMAAVCHENCIRNLAICIASELMLISQLMPNGSLLDYVRKHRDRIGSNALLTWGRQIASGMKYLEEQGIVHRDLAARNVLVEGPQMVKITDFGLAKLVYDKEEYQATGGKVPIKWLALESIQHRVFTHKSDVWSYGVTLWEIFTYGRKPYESVSARDLCDLLEKGERLPQPTICTIDIYMTMIKCWMVDAEHRPSFKDLVDTFTTYCKDPGRYLVIQEDDRMQLPSTEENFREMLRGLSILDNDDDGNQVVSAEDYLRPHDLLRDRLTMSNSGVDYKNFSEGSCSPSLSPMDCKHLSELESSFASRSGKDVSREPSQRYFNPYKDQKLAKTNSYTTEDGKKDLDQQVKYSEVQSTRKALDEDDYLRPLSTVDKRPKYIDLVGSNIPNTDYQNTPGELDYVNSRSEKTASVQNPEYFQSGYLEQAPC